MKEFIAILGGIALFVGMAWLYLKALEFCERRFGTSEPLVMRWLKRRNRPTTIFGKNDKDVL